MNQVNVVMIADNNYIVPTFVAMYSIIKSKNVDTALNLYVLGVDIKKELADVFCALGGENVNVKVVNESATKYANMHQKRKNSACVASTAALLKFDIPNIFDNLDKILYLDGDIIVRKDLSELYNTNIDDYFLAAVIDSGSLYSQHMYIHMVESYFNSGVMLLNLKKMRENNSTNVLIEEKLRQNDYKLMDQNVFNVVFDRQALMLPIKYNLLYVNLTRAKEKFKMKALNEMYSTSYEQLEDLSDDAVVIHYSSKDKPWKNKNTTLCELWDECFDEVEDKYELTTKVLRAKVGKKKVIVSLTTYPARIATVHITIDTIINQTVKPDNIYLWLYTEEFPNREKDLPAELLERTKQGLEIRWMNDNLRPHNKYYFTMIDHPEDIIITVDDDVIYEDKIVKVLLESYVRHPFAVSALRVHLMYGNNKGLRSYNDWKKRFNDYIDIPSMQLFATGVGGVLYPPHIMDEKVFDIDAIKELCLRADDIWLKFMQVKAGTPVVLAERHNGLKYIDGSQDCALWNTNEYENDVQFKNVLDALDTVSENGDSLFCSRCFDQNNLECGVASTNSWKRKYNLSQREVRGVRKSVSFRIGSFITWIPRKVRGGIRCIKEHGLSYTCGLFWKKLTKREKK